MGGADTRDLEITLDNIPSAKGLDVIPAKTTNEISKEIVMSEVKETTAKGSLYGIDETIDCVDCGVALANAISTGNITSFMSPLMKIPAALSGISSVPNELDDLSETELQTIIDKVKTDLNVGDDKAKNIAAKSIEVLYGIKELIDLIKG
jgi:hypothetical protein